MNSHMQDNAVGNSSSYIKARAKDLADNMYIKLSDYERRTLEMFGPVGTCICHGADTCSRCQSCHMATRMSKHVMAIWKRNLFQVHADACALEQDSGVSQEVKDYITYYIDHPGVSYKEWQQQKDVASILVDISYTSLNGPGFPLDYLKPYHRDIERQSGELDDFFIAHVPDEEELDITTVEEEDELRLDARAFYESSPQFQWSQMLCIWWLRVRAPEGDTVWDRYLAIRSIEFPHLRLDICCYLQYEIEIRFRGTIEMTLEELITASRQYFVERASRIIPYSIARGLRDPPITPQNGEFWTTQHVNRWALRTFSSPGALGLTQFMTNRETRLYSAGLVDFIENLGMFAQDCSMAKTRTQYAFCISRFIKQQFGISLLSAAHVWISTLVEEFVSSLAHDVDRHNEEQPEAQSGFGEFMTAYQSVVRSATWEKFAKLSMLLGTLAVGFFTGESVTLDKFFDICKSVYDGMKATEIVGQVLETIGAIYNKCIPVLMGKEKFFSIFQGLGDGRQLDLDIAHFLTQATAYSAGTPGKDDDDPTALMVKGLIIMKKCENVLAKCYSGKEREAVRRTLVSVTQAFNALSLKHSNVGVRAKPYSISLFGGTSVGKTCLSMQIIIMLQRALGIPCGQKYIYRMEADDNFMSCLTVLHNAFLLDDAANTKVQHAKVIISEPIIAIANNAPKAANMADLASKGVIPIKPNIFIATTNEKSLHAAEYSVCPAAILRRFESHITTSVKPEFATNKGVLRDDVNPDEHGYNIWQFTVEKYVPPEMINERQGLGAFEVRVDYEGKPLRNVDFETLCRFLVKDAQTHKARQDRYVDITERAHEQPYCACGMPTIACTRCVGVAEAGPIDQDVPEMQAGVMDRAYQAMKLWDVYKNPYVMPYIRQQGFGLFLLWALEAWWISYLLHSNYVLCILLASLMLGCLHIYMRVQTCAPQPVPTDLFVKMVERARTRVLGHKEAIFTTIAALATVYGVYKLNKSFENDTETQGSAPSRPVVIQMPEKTSPWITPDLAPVPRNSLTVTSTGKQLSDVLTDKLCVLYVYNGDMQKPTEGLFSVTFPVCTNFWIVPYHIISDNYQFVRVESRGQDKTNYCHSAFRAGSYKRIANTDYALLYMPNKGDQLDIRRFFPNKSDFVGEKVQVKDTPARVCYIVREKKTVEDKTIVEPVRYQQGVRVTSCDVAPRGIDGYWGGSYQFPVETSTGLCGSPIVAEGSGPFIVGLHSAGKTGTTQAYYCSVMRDEVEACIVSMTSDDTPMVQGAAMGNMDLNYPNMPFQHVIHNKCDFKFMDRAEVDIVGSNTASVRRYTSKVEKTQYSDRVTELFGFDQEHGKPALMNHWYPGRVWSEACANPKPVEMEYLSLAYKDLKDKIMAGLEEIPNAREQIYVMEDIANTSGVDGKRGLYKMNYAASAGIPYQKTKSNYIRPSDFTYEGISVPVELTDEMKADVKAMEDELKTGRRVYTPHRANRKDEAIKLGKAKVRIFSGTSMPYLFLMRKYFLSISVFMQEHPELFESAVGINCYSREWTRLYLYIVRYGEDRIIAGDYEKYDQYVANMMTYAAFKILLIIARWAGYDDEDIIVMTGLMTETCSPLYECDGSWFIFSGSTPSGHSLTVVINGLVNSMYARVAFYVTRPDGSTYSFTLCVAFMSYGDDNIMSVDEMAPWFTHTSYQSALARYGLNYTMADKTGVSVPYIGMKDATFLKRSWVYDDSYGRYKCPLEMSSISKMLHTMLVSGAVSREQQLADILRSANQEFFMYDQPTFEKAHASLLTIAKEFDLCHFFPQGTLPGWMAMDQWYRDIA